MNAENLKKIIEDHGKWRRNEPGGVRADLCDAVLRDAVLRDADLRDADLRGADLRGADLRGAVLTRAVLCDAVLCDAVLSGSIDGSVCRMDFGGWSICIRPTETSIGCQTHPNDFWSSASPESVKDMHDDAPAWWAVHGPAVCAAIRVVMEKAK